MPLIASGGLREDLASQRVAIKSNRIECFATTLCVASYDDPRAQRIELVTSQTCSLEFREPECSIPM